MWWNGTREIKSAQQDDDRIRLRTRCSNKDCTKRNQTIYTQDAYPYRRFGLIIVFLAIQARISGEKRIDVASKYECSGESIRLWTQWIRKMGNNLKAIEQFYQRLINNGIPIQVNMQTPAQKILYVFDRLAEALTQRLVKLSSPIFMARKNTLIF